MTGVENNSHVRGDGPTPLSIAKHPACSSRTSVLFRARSLASAIEEAARWSWSGDRCTITYATPTVPAAAIETFSRMSSSHPRRIPDGLISTLAVNVVCDLRLGTPSQFSSSRPGGRGPSTAVERRGVGRRAHGNIWSSARPVYHCSCFTGFDDCAGNQFEAT